MANRLARIFTADNQETNVWVGQDVTDQVLDTEIFRVEAADNRQTFSRDIAEFLYQVIGIECAYRHGCLKAYDLIVAGQWWPAFALFWFSGDAMTAFGHGWVQFCRLILCHGRPA